MGILTEKRPVTQTGRLSSKKDDLPNKARGNVYFRTTEKGIYIRVSPAGTSPAVVKKDSLPKDTEFTDMNPFGHMIMDGIRKQIGKYRLYASHRCHIVRGVHHA
jgi:serine/threonine protein kinase HipA of HipAB toxin-antitoxin module